MPKTKWPGPDTDEVTVADELAFDALSEETRLLVSRVVKHRLANEGEWAEKDERIVELERDLSKVEDENDNLQDDVDRLREALQEIADGDVDLADVVTFVKGKLAA